MNSSPDGHNHMLLVRSVFNFILLSVPEQNAKQFLWRKFLSLAIFLKTRLMRIG